MSIKAIIIESCGTRILEGEDKKLQVRIIYDTPADLKNKGVAIFYEDAYLLLADTGIEVNLQDSFDIPISINYDQFLALVKRDGFKEYRLRAVEMLAGGAEGVSFVNDVQFDDVIPDVTDVLVSSSSVGKGYEVTVAVEFFTQTLSFLVYNQKYDRYFSVPAESFQYDSDMQVWVGSVSIDTSFAACREPLSMQLFGEYRGPALPCIPGWEYSYEFEDDLQGVCMNTNWQSGLRIFWDSVENDSLRNILITAKTGHLIGSYSAKENSQTTLFARLEMAGGVLYQPTLLPSNTDSIKKDVDTTPISDSETDDFVSVWSSLSENSFRIYARKHTVEDDYGIYHGRPEVAVSGANDNYVAPRVIYNAQSGLIFICWVSVKSKTLQGIYRSVKDLSAASYTVDISNDIHPGYLNSSLDLGSAKDENIVLMNNGDNIIVGYQRSLREIVFKSIGKPVGGIPPISMLSPYQQDGMGKFHAVFDDKNSQIMIVYTYKSDIYGERIPVFSRENPEGRVHSKLNNNSGVCTFPYISKTANASGGSEFYVTWSAGSNGIFFNRFNKGFMQVDAEEQLNHGDTSNTYPKIMSSDNQVAVLFEASRYKNIALKGTGVLCYVESR